MTSVEKSAYRGRVGHWALIALAVIRLFNGGVALLNPNFLGRRLGVTTATSPGFGYAFRLFGVRTVLLGFQLLRGPDDARRRAIREALLIHGTDTAAALVVRRLNELPPGRANLAVSASALNVVLALAANLGLRSRGRD